ncbi:MAG: KH domain-containing protein [Candidatus Dadabacteria bacterium]|nr:KH domain-containing protein [Candidatus Dadabacteria bacterium]
MSQLREFVEFMAKSIVDSPDKVKVKEVTGEKTTVIELRVASDDMGKVIGRQGRTAKAIRSILSAAAAKMKKRAVLEILE